MQDQLILIMIPLVQQEKIGLTFKADTKFCVSSNCNGDESYLYANKTEICKFKAKDNLSWYNFSLGSTSKDLFKNEQTLNGTVCDFSARHIQLKKKTFLVLTNI